MPQPSTQLRKAHSTIDEGREFAFYLDQAAEGFFRFMLGPDSVEIIASAFTQPNHDLSYENVNFVERDKAIIGMVSGYTAEQHGRFSEQPLKLAAGRFNLRLILVSILFAPFLRIIDTIAPGDFYIQAIAIEPGMRGEGIGSVLMDTAEELAVNDGSTRISLDVAANNVGARRFYEHRDMTVESQWPKRMAIPGLKFYRMIKVL